MDGTSRNEREVGKVVSIATYKVAVLLTPDIRSQVRAYPQRITTITQISSYLLFPIAPGEYAIGIVVGASEDEAVEPDTEKGMTLQLIRARRILRVNLLGHLSENNIFSSGVSVYPSLETPALLPSEEELKVILEYKPIDENIDTSISLGISPIYSRQPVKASFNDLLSRPLGIIGNTGSGKSYTVASIVQSALGINNNATKNAKIIILDINGEYSAAFKTKEVSKELNRVYVNGEPFNLPLWTFTLSELIAFFNASQASQVPVLERVITSIREETIDPAPAKKFRNIIKLIDSCLNWIGNLAAFAAEVDGKYVSKNASEALLSLKYYFEQLISTDIEKEKNEKIKKFLKIFEDTNNLSLKTPDDWNFDRNLKPETSDKVNKFIDEVEPFFQEMKHDVITKGGLRIVTADSPIFFEPKTLERDALYRVAVSRFRGQERIQEYIATLRLRIHKQLSDKRWSIFTDVKEKEFFKVIKNIIGDEKSRVIVVDCSMLAYDVLPFFCAIFGRVLLELRAHVEAKERTVQPYILVLEEAHNYLRPYREAESTGTLLSREAFERIAKEGRKFGLSLIIASQRPSDVSHTVLSQCANFLAHRIQNPEDIDYFKKILPTGSRDLLDQIPILAPGDGLLLGSSVNVPSRVRVKKPKNPPESETPIPWKSWQKGEKIFDFKKAVKLWLQESE